MLNSVQFMDAVYQLTVQFPCAFEFNEDCLLKILDAFYSCEYGTFLFDNERERMVPNWSYARDR